MPPSAPPRRPGRMRQIGRRPRSSGASGFTMLEVMVALVLATIGLLGTVAVQQTMFAASANAQDAAVATRLASRALEELDSRLVSPGPPIVDQMAAAVTAGWGAPAFLNALGTTRGAPTPEFRFKRELQIVNLGAGQPYNVSVQVTYALDTGAPRAVRLDRQRWKTW